MTRRLAAIATALAGVVTLTSSLSANEPGRQALLEALEPGSAQAAAHALGAIGGLLTVWLAIGVLRGRRPAARAAVVVLGVLAVVHLAKGLDYEEASIALVLAFALHRGIEQAGVDRRPSRSLVAMLALLVGVAGAYAWTLTVLLVSGHSAGLGPTLWVAARSLAGDAPAAVSGDARTWLHLATAPSTTGQRRSWPSTAATRSRRSRCAPTRPTSSRTAAWSRTARCARRPWWRAIRCARPAPPPRSWPTSRHSPAAVAGTSCCWAHARSGSATTRGSACAPCRSVSRPSSSPPPSTSTRRASRPCERPCDGSRAVAGRSSSCAATSSHRR